jgi:hypothetical protein
MYFFLYKHINSYINIKGTTTDDYGSVSETACVCAKGYYAPNINNPSLCTKCDDSMVCSNSDTSNLGVNALSVMAKDGYALLSYTTDDNSQRSVVALRCVPPEACKNSSCSIGYTKDLCSACDLTYYREGGADGTGLCSKCNDNDNSSKLAYFYVLVAFLLNGLLVAFIVNQKLIKVQKIAASINIDKVQEKSDEKVQEKSDKKFQEKSNDGEPTSSDESFNKSILSRVILSHLQVLALIISGLRFLWPK